MNYSSIKSIHKTERTESNEEQDMHTVSKPSTHGPQRTVELPPVLQQHLQQGTRVDSTRSTTRRWSWCASKFQAQDHTCVFPNTYDLNSTIRNHETNMRTCSVMVMRGPRVDVLTNRCHGPSKALRSLRWVALKWWVVSEVRSSRWGHVGLGWSWHPTVHVYERPERKAKNNSKAALLAHACNLSDLEAEWGRWGLYSKTLDQMRKMGDTSIWKENAQVKTEAEVATMNPTKGSEQLPWNTRHTESQGTHLMMPEPSGSGVPNSERRNSCWYKLSNLDEFITTVLWNAGSQEAEKDAAKSCRWEVNEDRRTVTWISEKSTWGGSNLSKLNKIWIRPLYCTNNGKVFHEMSEALWNVSMCEIG